MRAGTHSQHLGWLRAISQSVRSLHSGRMDWLYGGTSSRQAHRVVTDALPTDPYPNTASDPQFEAWRDRLLDRFPPMSFAFAYGSGISAQVGSNKKVGQGACLRV